MKKTTIMVLVTILSFCGFAQLGNLGIKKPKLDVNYPSPPAIEIGGKKKEKKEEKNNSSSSNQSTSTNTNSSSTSSGSTQPVANTTTSKNEESKDDKLAKEEEYMIGLWKFIAPYDKFVEQFGWSNATSKEQIELFKLLDYDLFEAKNKEFKAYTPIDNFEFNQNDNKYKPRNAFQTVERFYERQYAAVKNGGKSLDPYNYPSIKENIVKELEVSYIVLKQLKEKEDNKYYEVDRKIESIELAVAPLEFWTSTEFLNDNAMKNDLAIFKKELANLKQIKATGADKAYINKKNAEYKADALSKVKISPAAMSNAAYEAKAKAKVEKLEKCVVKKVVITGSSWYIAKNSLGIPLDKSIPVEVAFTKDGKCYLLFGYMVKDYAGGGTYQEDAYFSYGNGSWDEMYCENIK